MIPERIGIKIWDLRAEARDELYLLIDKHYKKLPRNSDGLIKSSDPTHRHYSVQSRYPSYPAKLDSY